MLFRSEILSQKEIVNINPIDAKLEGEIEQALEQIKEAYNLRNTSKAIKEIMRLVDQINNYIQEKKPWDTAKNIENISKKDENKDYVIYEYEPEEEEVLKNLVPQNVAIQIFSGLLENAAGEQGARMTAMDSATRNAGELIDTLKLNYNRSRQAQITNELIEVISGAEVV